MAADRRRVGRQGSASMGDAAHVQSGDGVLLFHRGSSTGSNSGPGRASVSMETGLDTLTTDRSLMDREAGFGGGILSGLRQSIESRTFSSLDSLTAHRSDTRLLSALVIIFEWLQFVSLVSGGRVGRDLAFFFFFFFFFFFRDAMGNFSGCSTFPSCARS